MLKRQAEAVNLMHTIGGYANPEPQSVRELDAANAFSKVGFTHTK